MTAIFTRCIPAACICDQLMTLVDLMAICALIQDATLQANDTEDSVSNLSS